MKDDETLLNGMVAIVKPVYQILYVQKCLDIFQQLLLDDEIYRIKRKLVHPGCQVRGALTEVIGGHVSGCLLRTMGAG